MKTKDFTIKNREDKRILATLRKPEDALKGTMVLLHGLGGWKEQPLLVIIADTICRNGYNVVTFDGADGAKGPDGNFEHHTTTGYIHDLEDVLGYLKDQDWYSGPLILAGHSIGALVSLHHTRTHPAQISKLILLAPAVSWTSGLNPLIFSGGLWWLLRNKNKTPGPERSKLPLDRGWLTDFMKYNMNHDASYVSAPTLIISASRDRTVANPIAQFGLAKRFPDALSVVIPGAGHVFWKHEKRVADTITKWLTSS